MYLLLELDSAYHPPLSEIRPKAGERYPHEDTKIDAQNKPLNTPVILRVRKETHTQTSEPLEPLDCRSEGSPSYKIAKPISEKGLSERHPKARVILTSRYYHLWQTKDFDEFLRVFIDAIECHWHFYKEFKWVHRDINPRTIIFQRLPDGGVRGALNQDCDLVRHLTHPLSGVASPPRPRATTIQNRNGVLPFIAKEILEARGHIQRTYMHDLESFFYVFLWAAVSYGFEESPRLGLGQKEPRPPWMLEDWRSKWVDDVLSARKRAIFESPGKELIPCVKKAFRHLVDLPWVEKLASQFRTWERGPTADGPKEVLRAHSECPDSTSHEASKEPERRDSQVQDHESLEQKSFQTFLEALGFCPRSREEIRNGAPPLQYSGCSTAPPDSPNS
ncbi:hypothetical protein AX16_000603 [Volvariella volvacea WC 439]|nr:hypothetical protein AX16_000603 [Volvariella volvacea WC 439]